jgi:mannose-6-phosphate isomerase-like protein (cupin superfamily)
MLKKISSENAEHYKWGNNCDGWHLLKTDALNVIQERMPPGTSEQLHFHERAQQLFYILSGTAELEADGERIELKAFESIHIPKGLKHRISNKGQNDLAFLLISEPRAQTDRINV